MLEASQELRNRRQARTHLLNFTTYTKPDYRVNWHHRVLADYLERFARGEIKRLMVFQPPQTGKSELVSRRLPAYMLGINPEIRLLGGSHTDNLAVSMNRDVQRILRSRAYQVLFPETSLPETRNRGGWKCTQDYFEVPEHKGFLRSVGVGVAPAGFPADVLIVDDPFGKREDADSPTIRQRVYDWYTSDLYPRLSAHNQVLITHTRWHRDDLVGRLLTIAMDKRADQWTTVTFEAEKTGLVGMSEDPRQIGEALWPEHKSLEDLQTIKRQDANIYQALYQQNPADSGNTEWQADYFNDKIWVDEEDWPDPKKCDLKVISVDPSKGKESKKGDYSAIVYVGRHKGLFYVDCDMERRNPHKIVRDTRRMADMTKPFAVSFESDQFQDLIADEMESQCKDFAELYTILKISTSGVNKLVRIRRLGSFIVRRLFRFRKQSPGCHLLVDQLRDFPNADHDDGPDALDQARKAIGHLLGVEL